jgi:predicted Zn-dependent protease
VRFLVALVMLLAVACETVPITGRSQLVLVPEGTELQMGLESYQQILSKAKLSTDARLTEQVTRVGRRIAEATGRSDYQWEFKVIEDTQANAFCLPGGKVAVYTGMFRPCSATRCRTRSRGTAASGCRSSSPSRA